MDIFILRHGDAAQKASSDRERPLTSRGESELRAVLERAATELSTIGKLLVSPYLRTQQTASVAAEYLPASVQQETTELLVPEADPSLLIGHLYRFQQEQGASQVLLVSHQPLVGVLFDQLCGFDVGRYRLGTSALACISADPVAAGLGELRWLRQPADFD